MAIKTVKKRKPRRRATGQPSEDSKIPGGGPPSKAEGDKPRRTPADRWTPALVKDGFTPISTFFLKYYHELKPEITHGEAMFIIQLMSFKWDQQMPYPAYKTLARQMGIGTTQARNLGRALEKKRYLKRHARTSLPNLFDLRPLFQKLGSLRVEKVLERQKEAKMAGTRTL